MKEADRYQRELAVLFLDLDKFKWVNDTLGHDVGDPKQLIKCADLALYQAKEQGKNTYQMFIPA